MAVNLRKGAPTSTNIDYNVARMSVLEYWTWCRLLGSSRIHRIHGSLARKSQVSECRKKKKKKKKKKFVRILSHQTDDRYISQIPIWCVCSTRMIYTKLLITTLGFTTKYRARTHLLTEDKTQFFAVGRTSSHNPESTRVMVCS